MIYKWDKTIFDLMVLPAGVSKDTLVDNMLMELYELNVIYNQPDFLKMKIGIWANKNIDVWTKLYDTTQYEYNPIENYDRSEETTENETRNTEHSGKTGSKSVGKSTNSNTTDTSGSTNDTDKLDGTQDSTVTDTETRNATDKRTTSHNNTTDSTETRNLSTGQHTSGTNHNTESVAAFNNTAPVPRTYTDSTNSSDTTGTETGTVSVDGHDNGNGTDNLVMSGTFKHDITDGTEYGENRTHTSATTGKTTENGTTDNTTTVDGTVEDTTDATGQVTRTSRIRGNIGVTTTQQMIEAQRNVVKFNIYDYITDDFKENFCVLVY